MLRRVRVLAPAWLLTISACAHPGGGDVQRSDAAVAVEVTNQHALAMEVYAIGSGITQRLGTVHPGMGAHFAVPQNLVGNGSVRFEVRPNAGGQPFRSGEILLAPGALVDILIAPQLFNSTVTRRF